MDDDLVARLHDLGDRASYEPHMHHVAADRIEAQAADLAKERAQVAALRDALHVTTADRAEVRKAALEEAARLCDDTAQEALETAGDGSRMLCLWFRGQAKAIRALIDKETGHE